MAGSRTIYYDSEGNRKVFIGDPRKAPKSATKRKKSVRKTKQPLPSKSPARKRKDLDLDSLKKRKKFLPKPIKQIRVEGISQQPAKKFLPRPSKPVNPIDDKFYPKGSGEFPKIKNTYGPDRTSQKGVSKLALKGGGRAYGRNS